MTARQTKPRLPASPKATTAAISERELTRAHDDLHTGLDYIDEVARIIVDAAMNDETLDSKRLFFLAHSIESASTTARAAARRIPGSPYAMTDDDQGCAQ